MVTKNEANNLAVASSIQVFAYVNGERVSRAPRLRVNKTRYNGDIFWFVVLSPGELGQKGQGGTGGALFDPSGSSDPSDITKRLETLKASKGAVRKWRRINAVMNECPSHYRWCFQSRYRVDDKYIAEIRGIKAAFDDLATLVWDMAGLPDPKNSAPILRSTVLHARGHRSPVQVPKGDGTMVTKLKRRPEMSKDDARRKWATIAKVESGAMSMAEYERHYPGDAPLLSSEATRLMLRNRLSHFKPNSPDPFVVGFRDRAEALNRAAHLEYLRIERDQAEDFRIPRSSVL